MNAPATLATGQWPARLELGLARRGERTRLAHCRHHGPLYVQKPFYPEGDDHPHLYLLHPPGGIVSGDDLSIELTAAPGTGALVTTPGAARVYRARPDRRLQRQVCRLRVEAGAALEWFPLETILFDDAEVSLETHVDLGADSCFIGWEVTSFGLPATGEVLSGGSFRQSYRIEREGRPLFLDRLVIDDRNREALLNGQAGLRGNMVSGLFLAGPVPEAIKEPLPGTEVGLFAASQCGAFLVGRYLGDNAEQARAGFCRWWEVLRPQLLQRDAVAPRIWAT